MTMEVISLISGGKDSFFSLLHCIANGHKIVALANLHPPLPDSVPQVTVHLPSEPPPQPQHLLNEAQKDELDSFMYQTVGHTLLPLYAGALSLPLYRYPITGGSVNQELFYSPRDEDGEGDETEDLVPLLKYILARHPTATAVSTGAILSTYQRTRIESVCSRLGLTSLSYLWQRTQSDILREMEQVGLDARIIKVAAAGLEPEKWLWRNVAKPSNRRKLNELQTKWGVHPAGEGGEYETIVVNGPGWKGGIVVEEEDREVVTRDGGTGYLRITNARLEMNSEGEHATQQEWVAQLTKPDLWDDDFLRIKDKVIESISAEPEAPLESPSLMSRVDPPPELSPNPPNITTYQHNNLLHITNISSTGSEDVHDETITAMTRLSEILAKYNTNFSHITSTTLLLRSMADFATVNSIYSRYFTTPNPPSRVCVAVGRNLPEKINILLSATVDLPTTSNDRKGLHVQGRSYWAPANIGPYSQSICVNGWIALAGMVPLIPSSMDILNRGKTVENVTDQAVFSLQHMWRVAKVVDATEIIGCVAFVTGDVARDAACVAWRERFSDTAAVRGLYTPVSESEKQNDGSEENENGTNGFRLVQRPPLLVVAVAGLPRGSAVEWAGVAVDGPWVESQQQKSNEADDSPDITISLYSETTPILQTASSYFGAWDLEGTSSLPVGGGVKILTFPVEDTVEEIVAKLKEALAEGEKVEGRYKLRPSLVTVYLPPKTAGAGELIDALNVDVAVGVVPVEGVWDWDGVEASAGALVRLGPGEL